MASIRVHGMPMSTCTARVLLCLREKDLDYELVSIDVPSGEHKKQPYLSLNPFGQIPALEDGSITLFESRAISRYIARKHKDKGTDLLRSNSFTESAIVETWLEVEAHQFNPPISAIFRQLLVNPIYGLPSDEKTIELELGKLEKVLDVYEERLSKSEYLAGDYYTLADLHHVPFLLHFMKTSKATVVTSRPRVRAWWSKISAREAAVKLAADVKL